jgi:Cu(I)/Ag(I) efflux system periplasmic protein CusF
MSCIDQQNISIKSMKNILMKKLSVVTIFLSLFALAPLGAMAQSAMAGAGKTVMQDPAEGEVRKIDRDAKKITLKHGPINNLRMPGMTMVFLVKDLNLLDGLAAGDKVMFTVEVQQGAMVITGLEKNTTK